MKIGIDISQIAYKGSGIASYTQNLVKALLKIDQKNHYVLFASALRKRSEIDKFKKTLDSNLNCEFNFYPFPPKLMTFLWNKLHIFPIEYFIGDIDVFHTSDWTEPPAKAFKVTTIHDLLIFRQSQNIHPEIIANQKTKLKWVTKESKMIITDSESSKDDIVHFLKIPENKIKVIYLGINPIFKPQKQEEIDRIKSKYQLQFDYLLCVGVNDKRKNWDLIVEAFSKIHSPKIKMVGVSSFLKSEIHEDEKLKIINTVDEADMPGLYAGAKALIYPSLYEGFGLPVLEAMACGTPVISSDKGSLREIAGKYCLIVDPSSKDSIAHAINQILNLSNEEKSQIIQKGIEHAKKYTWEKCARETLEIYEDLL